MRNKSVTKNSSGFTSWMDDFLLGMSKKLSKTASEEVMENDGQEENLKEEVKLAEVNINDLEKVIWNDETFYVQFDNAGATVYNEFGNSVTTLQGVFSISDVDNALNGKQVVVSSTEKEDEALHDEDFQSELAKVVSSLDDSEDKVVTTADVEDESADFDEEDQADTDLNAPENGYQPEKSNEQSTKTDEFTEAVASGFETLESKLAALEEQIQQVQQSQQEYARKPELEPLDNGAVTEEQKHYEETATSAQEQINSEHAIDITTPQGRVELSQHTVETAPTEEVQTENIEQTPVVENNENVETSIDESKNDSPVEEKQENEDEVTTEPKVDVTKSTEETTEENSENSKDSNEDHPHVATLSIKDARIFKHAVCPSCGEKSLTLSKLASNLQGVYCGSCPSEYAVNTETEEIFVFKG